MSEIGAAADPSVGHARRKSAAGRWQVLVDGHWVSEDAVKAWEAVARLGSQAAAAKELGVAPGTLLYRLDAYMSTLGIHRPRPGASGAGRSGGRRRADHTRAIEPLHSSEVDGPEAEPGVSPPGSATPAGGRADTAPADPAIPTPAPDEEQVPGPGKPSSPPRDLDVDRIALPFDVAADLLLDGLFGLLPEPGSAWSWDSRERWFGLATALFKILYQGSR